MVYRMIRVKKAKAKARLLREREKVRKILQGIADASLDPYLGYRQLNAIYCRTSGLHDEIRHFFRVPGVEADGIIRVDDAFRQNIRALAKEWLVKHRD